MRAVLLNDSLQFRSDHPRPLPAACEAVVRVTRAGICNTDVELIRGYMGFRGVLGHEFAGVIDQLPPDAGDAFAPGMRVVGEINCVPCESPSRDYFSRAQDAGRTTLGIDRRDGAFADYVRVPLANLHRVPDGVGDDEAVFAEPLAAACQILEQVHVKPTERAAVLGDGKLGLLCAQVLAAAGAQVVGVGRHANKLAILAARGIPVALPAEAGGGYDVVVECTGSPAGFEAARRMLRPRGTLVLKSTYAPVPADAAPAGLAAAVNAWMGALTRVVVDEISVVGSRCGPFATALRLLAEQRVDVRALIHARFPLERAAEAIARAQQPGVLKVLLDVAA